MNMKRLMPQIQRTPQIHRTTNADSVGVVTRWIHSKGAWSCTSARKQTGSVSSITQSLEISGKWNGSVWLMNINFLVITSRHSSSYNSAINKASFWRFVGTYWHMTEFRCTTHCNFPSDPHLISSSNQSQHTWMSHDIYTRFMIHLYVTWLIHIWGGHGTVHGKILKFCPLDDFTGKITHPSSVTNFRDFQGSQSHTGKTRQCV